MDVREAARIVEELAAVIGKRAADEEARIAAGRSIESSLEHALRGGAMRVRRFWPYSFLTVEDLQALERAEAAMPWPVAVKQHVPTRWRLDAMERAMADTVGGTAATGVADRLVALLTDIEAQVREQEFLLPLDNVLAEEGAELRLGPLTVRALSDADWTRYAGEVVGAAERSKASGREKGAMVANHLAFERELRPAVKEGEPRPAVVHVRAWGSPRSAYLRARDDAHFAIAVLKFLSGGFEERSRQFIALKGENLGRERGWRIRFGSGAGWPSMWFDGTGPGVPLILGPSEGWPGSTREFMAALDRVLSRPATPVERRLLTAIYHVGSALNRPAFEEDAELGSGERAAKPTGIEVAQRIRDLVTATAAVFKKPEEGKDKHAMARLREAVAVVDPQWVADHWAEVDRAFSARHDWTHTGVGPREEGGAMRLSAALQAVLMQAVIAAERGDIETVEKLCEWRPAK